jgi:mono/diheme cytochrome c family protein
MRSSHTKAVLACGSALLSLVPVLALSSSSTRQEVPVPRTLEDPSVAPVEGPSWLTRRNVPYDRTSLGAATRDALTGDQRTEAPQQPLATLPTLVLDGAALYRLNCLACHREESLGAPLGSPSILQPVEGSSLKGIRQRLRQDATGGNLMALIRHGSALMPARDHLNDDDLEALSVYLTQSAGPDQGARRARRVRSWAHLGEHVVKGTCHICHDAIGPRPSAASAQQGEIPSLEALLAMKSVTEFVHKARNGLPVMADEPGLFHAGRMPRFDYLRDEEIAAAYLFLAVYPPTAERR